MLQVSDDFAYKFESGMEAKVKAFRQRGTGGDCIIMRIDHEEGLLLIDEQCKALPDLEALAEKLEDVEPRYVLYIHKVMRTTTGLTDSAYTAQCALQKHS